LCAPNKDGIFVIKPETPIELTGVGGYQGAGQVVKQDTSRISFRKLTTVTTKRHALRFDFVDSLSSAFALQTGTVSRRGAKRDLSRTLENVIALPQDVFDQQSQTTVLRGIYVTIADALRLWDQEDIENPDELIIESKRIRKLGKQSMTKESVYPVLFNGDLVQRWTYGFLAQDKLDLAQIWAARAQALSAAVRVYFRIPDVYLDAIQSLELADVVLVDPISGTRAPAQVFCDHFALVSRLKRYKRTLTHPSASRPGVNRYAWSEDLEAVTNFDQLPLNQATLCDLASLSWENKAFGIMKLNFKRDISAQFLEVKPYLLQPATIPKGSVGVNPNGYHTILESLLLPYWRFSTVISAVLKTPNDQRQFYRQTFKGPPSHLGPNVEIETNSVTADYAWNDATSKIVETADGVEVRGGDLINESILKDVGRVIFERAKFVSEDRELGQFKSPGFGLAEIRGHVRGVEIFHQNGEIATWHDASTPPAPPQFKAALSQEARRVIFRDGADS
jgi:hypothetical protein